MENDYVNKYSELYEKHWWWRAREKVLSTIIRNIFRTSNNLKILDVGCGDGLFFKKLSEFGDVYGIEPDKRLISKENLNNPRIYKGCFDDSYDAPFNFDLITMLDVIEHIEDETNILNKAHNCLSKDGKLIITVPALQILWTKHDEVNHHYRRYSKTSLIKVLQEVGIKIDSCNYLFQFVGIFKLLARIIEKFYPATNHSSFPPAWINKAMMRASVWEYTLLKNTNVSFGSSLIAICSK